MHIDSESVVLFLGNLLYQRRTNIQPASEKDFCNGCPYFLSAAPPARIQRYATRSSNNKQPQFSKPQVRR